MDALKEGTYGNGGSAIPDQWFPKATPGETPQWPGQFTNGAFVLSWLLFVTGTFQFLDGGRLDLGVVRHSVLTRPMTMRLFWSCSRASRSEGTSAIRFRARSSRTAVDAGTIAVDGYAE